MLAELPTGKKGGAFCIIVVFVLLQTGSLFSCVFSQIMKASATLSFGWLALVTCTIVSATPSCDRSFKACKNACSGSYSQEMQCQDACDMDRQNCEWLATLNDISISLDASLPEDNSHDQEPEPLFTLPAPSPLRPRPPPTPVARPSIAANPAPAQRPPMAPQDCTNEYNLCNRLCSAQPTHDVKEICSQTCQGEYDSCMPGDIPHSSNSAPVIMPVRVPVPQPVQPVDCSTQRSVCNRECWGLTNYNVQVRCSNDCTEQYNTCQGHLPSVELPPIPHLELSLIRPDDSTSTEDSDPWSFSPIELPSVDCFGQQSLCNLLCIGQQDRELRNACHRSCSRQYNLCRMQQ